MIITTDDAPMDTEGFLKLYLCDSRMTNQGD